MARQRQSVFRHGDAVRRDREVNAMKRYEIVSEPGAAIEVTQMNLTPEEEAGLTINVRLSDICTHCGGRSRSLIGRVMYGCDYCHPIYSAFVKSK